LDPRRGVQRKASLAECQAPGIVFSYVRSNDAEEKRREEKRRKKDYWVLRPIVSSIESIADIQAIRREIKEQGPRSE
jgi:hypothetical protein